MARYLAFLIGDPARKTDYDTVLKPSSLEEMWTPQITASAGEGADGGDAHARGVDAGGRRTAPGVLDGRAHGNAVAAL